MTTSTDSIRSAIRGGSFLLEDRRPEDVFTPEDVTDQHRLIARTAQEFVEREIVPRLKAIEEKERGLLRELLRKAGELGLCAADVPRAFGGLDLDKISSVIISEKMARDGAWAATIGAQSGIGILPIAFFGTDAQKSKYVPKLASGEWVGAYCLSEAGAASDALHCATRALLSSDGKHYLLNGAKMWVTNGGIADVYIVFARVDGEKFTAFIVEGNFAGVRPGAEEHKMGIRGSSTTPLSLEDAPVPVENVLGEIGKGHRIAFNILNIGRLKLGAGCVGGCKILMIPALKWATERIAFGRPIAEFGLIKEKLGGMVARIYTAESVSYRTAGLIDHLLGAAGEEGSGGPEHLLAALQEFAVECSILKVMGTEALDRVVDEVVQIFGGYGFTTEYEVERTYRDQRVNRIFEGTNEINRLLIVDMLMKRSASGELPLAAAAREALDGVLSSAPRGEDESDLAMEHRMLRGARQAALLLAGSAMQRYGPQISEEQEVLGAISNIVIETYGMESALLRASKASADLGPLTALHLDAARCAAHVAIERIESEARRALARIAEGDALRAQAGIVRRFLKREPLDTISIKRRLAEGALERKAYPFACC